MKRKSEGLEVGEGGRTDYIQSYRTKLEENYKAL